MAYFFCEYEIKASLKPRTILGSLARQLLHHFWDSTIITRYFAAKSIDIDEVFSLLRNMLTHESRAYIVLDGMTECDPDTEAKVTSFLGSLRHFSNISICLSSRSDSNEISQIQRTLFGPVIILQVSVWDPDFLEFVKTELDVRFSESDLLRPTESDPNPARRIRDALIATCKGSFSRVMFRLDLMVLEDDNQAMTAHAATFGEDAARILTHFLTPNEGPKSLLDEKSRRDIHRVILQLIAVAERPLTMLELQGALSVSPAVQSALKASKPENGYPCLNVESI